MLTDLDLAQREHMQAARHLRRIEQEMARRRSLSLDREHDRAYQRWQASLERLRAAEAATRQAGAPEAPATN